MKKMNLHEYWISMPQAERLKFVGDCKVSYGHMINVIYGFRRCSAELAIKIERYSRGIVKKESVAPHVEW
nr:MAG TPA: hypothetical protein [Bacteriophage sp.]